MTAQTVSDVASIAGGGLRGVSLLLGIAMLITGSNGRDAQVVEGDAFHVRFINLVADAPVVDIELGATRMEAVPFGSGTQFKTVRADDARLSLRAGAAASAKLDIASDMPAFAAHTPYTLIAYGDRSAPHLFAIEGWRQRDGVADGNVVLQFTHAAPSAPPVDVYVTASEAGATISRHVGTLKLTQASVPLELTLTRAYDGDSLLTGDVTIDVRAHASGRVLYKSQPIAVVERQRTLFVIANGETGAAAVKLVNLSTMSR